MDFEKKFKKKIKSEFPDGLNEYCESLKIDAYVHGKLKLSYNWGPDYKYYDLASLTKPIFTNSAFMKIHSEYNPILLMDVGEILGWENFFGIKIQDLLTHQAGLIWWLPYYEKLLMGDIQERRENLSVWISEEKPVYTEKAVYSDLDYLALGFVLENLLNMNLNEVWDRYSHLLGQHEFHFNILNSDGCIRAGKSGDYAPTYSHQLGKKMVYGVVNDANTQQLGGISTHAGLFGRVEDVGIWYKILRKSLYGNDGIFKNQTLKKFTRRAMDKKNGDWSYGFMLPSKEESSSGKYFSKESIGHLGFTGTSFWWDLKKDIFITMISNRHLQKNLGEDFKRARPLLHNLVWETLHE